MEKKHLNRDLIFAKIFFRWRLNVEESISRHAQRQWYLERKAIRDHLHELKLQMHVANDMEAKYVSVALQRGEEIYSTIKAIHTDIETHAQSANGNDESVTDSQECGNISVNSEVRV